MRAAREYVMVFEDHHGARVSAEIQTVGGNVLRRFAAVSKTEIGPLLRRGAEYVAARGGQLPCNAELLLSNGIARSDGALVVLWGRKRVVADDGTVDLAAAVRE